MWNFISGVTEPQKRKSQDDKREYSKEYEKTKRTRSYLKEWEQGRPWLRDGENGMTCKICHEFSKDRTNNLFLEGCKSYKLDSIIKHEKSKSHEKCVLVSEAQKKSSSQSKAFKIIETLNVENIDKLSKLFRTCHAMVKNNRPLSDYNWLCQLDEMKGLYLGQTYRNTNSAKNFIKAIAEREFDKVSDIVKKGEFVCLIGDGSTDASVKEQELWYLRTAISGNVVVKFLGVKHVEKADAQNIVDGIKDLITGNLNMEYQDVIKKTVALSCDGASVMVGCRAGVGQLLRNDQQSLITLHCMAHRLELALKDATKSVKLYDKSVTVLCMDLYYFYHNSALNRAMLYRSFNAAKKEKEDKLLIPTRAGGTRWVGHVLKAVTNVINSYKYIVAHLGQLTEPAERVSVDSKAKATAFLKLLQSKDVICFLLFLMDVLGLLRRLSLQLQDRQCVISKQYTTISSTIEALRKFQTSDGPYLRKVVDTTEFQGISLKYCNIQQFTAARKTLLEKILTALELRFREFSSESVVKATRMADLQLWPKEWNKLKDFGDADLQIIVDHFQRVLVSNGTNCEEAELEWSLLKKEVFDLDLLADCEQGHSWGDLQQKLAKGENFKNIFSVINLIMTIAPTSSEAERGFSQLKLIKTDLRTKLGQDLLNFCMSIKLLSPEIIEFDPKESIDHWITSGDRAKRPNFKDNLNEVKNLHLNLEANMDNIETRQQPIIAEEIMEKVNNDDIPIDTDTYETQKKANDILDMMEAIRKDMKEQTQSDNETSDYDSDALDE